MKKRSSQFGFFGLGKLKPYVAKYNRLFSAMIICRLVNGLFQSFIPFFQKYAIDNFIGKNTFDGLLPFILLYVAGLAVIAVMNYIASYDCCKLEMFLLRDMRRAAFNHLQTLSVAYFNANGVGKIHSRVMSDTGAISSVLSWDVCEGVYNLAYVISAVVVMFILNPILALCVVTLIPLATLVSIYFTRKLTKINRRVRHINSEITGAFNEGITGAETAKTLAIEDKLDKNFTSLTGEMKREATKQGHFRAVFSSLISFASYVALALVLWYGGIITSKDILGLLGTLTMFMTYAQGLIGPVQWAVDAIADLINVKVNAERFDKLMQTESDVKDKPEVIEIYGDSFNEKRENWEKIYGDIEFSDVTFRYPDGDENVLEHFDLKIKKGSNVAIVGETGAGKSTIINLVCRFYEPTSGKILIDGKDYRERSVQWLHSNIGYVLQTPHLFSGSVRENILYGKEDADDTQITAALESVGALKAVERLGGLDARIGEDGNSLSTGEKQLLSLARAVIADPAIFVLDEATSSIDTINEKLIQSAVEKIMNGRTSFVIAHRLSTVKNADIILVIDDGKIVEYGNHSQLIEKKGKYYNLYLNQFRREKETLSE